MADMHTPLLPWRADGDCDDWSTPSHDTAGVSGCAPIVDERGEVVAFAVGVGWNDKDVQRRDLIIAAVNERPALLARASQDAETIKALRKAAEPFANYGEILMGQKVRDDSVMLDLFDCKITVSDFRKLFAALAGSAS